MATEISNIDDILVGAKTHLAPQAPEFEPAMDDYAPEIDGVEEVPLEKEKPFRADNAGDDYLGGDATDEDTDDKGEAASLAQEEEGADEYGNAREEENPVIRERLARQAKKYEAEMAALRAQIAVQQQPPTVQQAEASGFEYNPDSGQTWDQQLASFVEHTVNTMEQRKEYKAQQLKEQAAQLQFENKFRDDVSRFEDFREVIGAVPATISDHMVHATRGMKNPAAFLYAAAKRAPQELVRISAISDGYVQIAEMGRLEETLRQTKPFTKAPRPVARTQEDGRISHESEKEPSIEELIAKSEAKKKAIMAQRRR